MRRLLFACVLFVTTLPGLSQIDPAPWPTRQWTTATPASQGLNTAVLADLVNHLATPRYQTDSIILVRNGRLVFEGYAAPFRAELRHDMRSMTKTVVATLVGAALQEGKLRSDQEKVLGFFPGRTPSSPGQEALTIRHLLDMQAGIDWREWPYDADSDAIRIWDSPNYTDYILGRQVTAPGERFSYMGAGPHLLSAILTRSTGSNAAEYARRHVFKTLGITDFVWPADPQGHSTGDSGLRMKSLDMARIGLLYLRKGRWEGRQLLPPGWAEVLFTDPGPAHGLATDLLPPTYRGLWWTDGKVPYATASGRHGQLITVMPEQDLVLVVTGKADDEARGAGPASLVRAYLRNLVQSDTAVATNAAAQAKLERALQRLAQRQGPESRRPSASALAQARHVYVLEPNDGGYREFALELGGPEPRYHLLKDPPDLPGRQSPRAGPLGLEGRYLQPRRAADGSSWVQRGRWLDDRTFRIEAQDLEAAFVAEWTAKFTGDGKLELAYADGDDRKLTLRGRARDPGASGSAPRP